MARRADHRPCWEPRDDPAGHLAVDGGGGRKTDHAVSVCREAGAADEVLVPADAAELQPVDAVGDDLAGEVDSKRTVDGDHVTVSPDHFGRVDHLHRQEPDVPVLVEPLIELGHTGGEGGGGETVEGGTLPVCHLARLVEPHETGGEHLGVDAEVADAAGRDHLGDLAGDAADARLKGAAVVDEPHRVTGDRGLHLCRFGIGEVERLAVGPHEDVDLVERQAVRVVGFHPERAREVLAHLHDEEPVRVGAGTVQLVDRCAGVQGETDPSVHGHRAGGCHDARAEVAQNGLEPAEVGRHVVDRRTGVAEEPLGRAEEPAAVVDAAPGEERVEVGEQRPEHLEPHEVVAFAQCVEEPARHSRAERHGEGVDVADPVDGLADVGEVHGAPSRRRDRGRGERRWCRPRPTAATPRFFPTRGRPSRHASARAVR